MAVPESPVADATGAGAGSVVPAGVAGVHAAVAVRQQSRKRFIDDRRTWGALDDAEGKSSSRATRHDIVMRAGEW